ncbi:MAG: hypothetical protein IPJ97_10160 [Proteobacteria bacterium]|nr:hypothetical protein [Pseudomonadota bacterium]
MKITIRALVPILLLASSPVLGQDKPVSIFSYEDASCGAWIQSANVQWAREQYISWFRGFVSGYNYATPGNQVQLERMPNNQTFRCTSTSNVAITHSILSLPPRSS